MSSTAMSSGGRSIAASGRRALCARHGFSLVELLIVITILGILATVVVPQFSNANVTAKENMLKDELRYLRTQIVVFKAQHKDKYPGPDEAGFVAQMTKFTDEEGNTSNSASPVFRFGPYLSQMPKNPLSQLTTIRTVGPTAAMTPANPETYGWTYKPTTGELAANSNGADSHGVNYYEY